MNKQSLGPYLALHRPGYVLAGLWAALWAGLLAGFFWYFRIESGLAKDDDAFDAMMQMPVSDAIQISRLAALYMLAPLSGMMVAGLLILADTLLFLLHLDRDKLWFDAIKWCLSGWRAFLVWLALFFAICILPVFIGGSYMPLVSVGLGTVLITMLPFSIWNKACVVSKKPVVFVAPQWPGALLILLTAAFVAISLPLMVLFDNVEPAIHMGLVLIIDLLESLVTAACVLLLSFMWINQSIKPNLGKVLKIDNVGPFFSLNMMLGLWMLFLFLPPVGFITIILNFLAPSIQNFYREQGPQLPALLKYSLSVGDFFAAYWWAMLIPVMYWLLMHGYGRLIFLLGLIETKDNALEPDSQG